MIPLRDSVKSRKFPIVNTIIIVVNILIFFYEVSLGREIHRFIFEYGLIPSTVTSFSGMGVDDRLSPFLTSMFLHGSWFHIIGNMLFLYIFGDNVEDRMGHVKYLLFYLLCGFGAAILQILTSFKSTVPMIGASGAISGVLGAYLLLYPRAKILTLVPIFFFVQLMYIPATVFILIWFFIQFISGVGTLGSAASSGGIAFWAHIGGFVVGLVIAKFFIGSIKFSEKHSNGYYN